MNHPKTVTELWREAAAFIESHDAFLVVSHIQPDGDAIGSTLAMAHALQQLGKSFVLTNPSPLPEKYDFLEMASAILPWDEAKKSPFDAVISVDAADRERIDTVGEVLDQGYPVLNIDHHPTNDRFGTVNVVCSDRAATAEMVYELIEHFGLKWNQTMAEAVYTGIMADTGGFRYANTSPRVMKVAAHLLQYGVIASEIAERVFETISHAKVRLLKDALNSLTISEDGRIAWIRITADQMKQAKAKEDDLGGIVNFARNVEGVEVGILFKQVDEHGVKVSLRSRQQVDVSQIASELKGGGHARAAGCYVEGGLDDVEEKVLLVTRRALAR